MALPMLLVDPVTSVALPFRRSDIDALLNPPGRVNLGPLEWTGKSNISGAAICAA